MGVKIRSEIAAIIEEIEAKCGEDLYAEFTEQEGFMLAQSFVDRNRIPVILVDPRYQDTGKKLEAIIIHELLHLRLRVNNYPVFLFSPTINTQRGRAIDVEQGNMNDMKNLIDHRIFKAEMERYGLYKHIDLSGDTVRMARRSKGQLGGNAETVNYARAVLEYLDPKDVAEVKQAYAANGWTREISAGQAIADIISTSSIKTPADFEAVLLRCLPKLYPLPSSQYAFTLTLDTKNTIFRRMIINAGRRRTLRRR